MISHCAAPATVKTFDVSKTTEVGLFKNFFLKKDIYITSPVTVLKHTLGSVTVAGYKV